MRPILGCDLSLVAAAFVAVPPNWAGDWSRIARHHVGHSLPRDAPEMLRIGRLHRIAAEAVAFSQRHGCQQAILEDYAFGARQSQAHALGEVGGVVRLALMTQGGVLDVRAVHSASARKLILGKLPRRDVKAYTRLALHHMGMPQEWTDDEADAFVVANWLLSGSGGFALAVPQEETKRAGRTAA